MDFRAIASELLRAEAERKPIEPLTDTFPGITTEDAYRIQLEGVASKREMGRKIIGKKIGLTSEGMQKLMNVNQPDYGHLFEDMLLLQGEPCRCEQLIGPRVEAELAFILKETLMGPGVTIADVYRATEGVMPSLEIVDSRIRDWKIKLQDTVADNASAAKLVLGSCMVPIKDLDWRLIGMVIEKNGLMVSNAAGAAVWGHPAASVAWLANTVAPYGVPLKAGEIILSGAFTAAETARAGDVLTASFYGMGSLSLRFI